MANPISSSGVINGLTVFAEQVLEISRALNGTGSNSIYILGDVKQGSLTNKTDDSTSFAQGYLTTASGQYSHAEGNTTQVTGDYAHAEGYDATAQGNYSHAEGNTSIAVGNYSHAEGTNTNATGLNSHAEGAYTQAVGNSSHAEGYYTIAYSDYQSAVGRYNKDLNSSDYFVVGVGANAGARADGLGVNATRTYISNSVYLPNLTNVAQDKIVAYSSSGQIYYVASESIKVTSASYAISSSKSVSSSYALTASYALNGGGGGGGTPGGLNKQIQFNSASIFSGSSNFTYDYTVGNLIYNASDLGYSYPEYINNPNDYSSSALIGIGLSAGTYPFGGNGVYSPFTTILGMFNAPNIITDPTDPNTFSNIPTFVVGNGDWFSNYPTTLTRANAIEVGYDFTSFQPYISLPQLASSNTGYVVTVNPSNKRLSYTTFNVVGGNDKQIQFNNNGILAGATGFNYITGSSNVLQFTGSFTISGSEYIKGSGSAIFEVDGTVGPLLTVNDSNTGSLFTVNDISGMPIVDVRSNNSMLVGSSNAPSLNSTKKITSTGAQSFALGGTLILTSSYNAAFFEYAAYSASNARSGYITATWNGSTIVSSSITSSNIGDTSGLITFPAISGSYIVLSGSANAASWTVKSIIRAI